MNAMNSTRRVLLIGYGNDLRGDDCAGRRVAEIIADRGDGLIEVRSVHQLTPDLAPLIAEQDLAIFADASSDKLDELVQIRKLVPAEPSLTDAHVGTPPDLLALAGWLYGHCPEAYAVDITAENFDFCLTASSRTLLAIDAAVICVDNIVAGKLEDVKCMK